jgi:hypothetical protein
MGLLGAGMFRPVALCDNQLKQAPLARLPSGWLFSPIWSKIAYITINDREEPISLVFKVVTPERDR